MVSITEHDMKTLEPGKFLNDTIIDFWMCWLMRKELPKESAVHIAK
jgi:Ulp1 family protease